MLAVGGQIPVVDSFGLQELAELGGERIEAHPPDDPGGGPGTGRRDRLVEALPADVGSKSGSHQGLPDLGHPRRRCHHVVHERGDHAHLHRPAHRRPPASAVLRVE